MPLYFAKYIDLLQSDASFNRIEKNDTEKLTKIDFLQDVKEAVRQDVSTRNKADQHEKLFQCFNRAFKTAYKNHFFKQHKEFFNQ